MPTIYANIAIRFTAACFYFILYRSLCVCVCVRVCMFVLIFKVNINYLLKLRRLMGVGCSFLDINCNSYLIVC